MTPIAKFTLFVILFFGAPGVLYSESFPRASSDVIVVEKFSKDRQTEGIPDGWKIKRWAGDYHISIVREPDQNDVLHMKSKGTSFGLFKEIEVNLKQYPILSWRWKVTELPAGGDVRSKKTDDQAAQVYVVFPRFPAMVNSRMLGYIWENLTPKGLHVQSQKSSNTMYVVLQNGPERIGSWQRERRNVYEDYKELFGEEPPKIGGVTLMIDSDDTESSAEAFFDDIQFEIP